MGTTSEKLTYLNETKQELKQKINNLGGSIDDNTTFRNYANQLQNVYDNYPKTSFQTGTEVTLENCNKGKLDYDNGVVGIGQSSQATRQYIDVGTWEQGSIDGTTGENTTNSGMVRTIGYTEVKPNILYELSRSVYSGFMVFRFYDSNKNYLGSQATTGMVTSSERENRMEQNDDNMTMTIINASVAYMRLSDASNDLSTIYTIYTDSTPSPSYPQEIKCVTGNQDVVVSGKNYLPMPSEKSETTNGITFSTNGKGKYIISGKLTNATNTNIDFPISKILKAGTYYWHLRNTGTITARINIAIRGNNSTISYLALSEINRINSFTLSEETAIDNIRLTIDSGYGTSDSIDITLEPTIELTGDTTTYEPYITPTTYPISLGNNKFYGCGDYKDKLVTDRLTKKWYKLKEIHEFNGKVQPSSTLSYNDTYKRMYGFLSATDPQPPTRKLCTILHYSNRR